MIIIFKREMIYIYVYVDGDSGIESECVEDTKVVLAWDEIFPRDGCEIRFHWEILKCAGAIAV